MSINMSESKLQKIVFEEARGLLKEQGVFGIQGNIIVSWAELKNAWTMGGQKSPAPDVNPAAVYERTRGLGVQEVAENLAQAMKGGTGVGTDESSVLALLANPRKFNEDLETKYEELTKRSLRGDLEDELSNIAFLGGRKLEAIALLLLDGNKYDQWDKETGAKLSAAPKTEPEAAPKTEPEAAPKTEPPKRRQNPKQITDAKGNKWKLVDDEQGIYEFEGQRAKIKQDVSESLLQEETYLEPIGGGPNIALSKGWANYNYPRPEYAGVQQDPTYAAASWPTKKEKPAAAPTAPAVPEDAITIPGDKTYYYTLASDNKSYSAYRRSDGKLLRKGLVDGLEKVLAAAGVEAEAPQEKAPALETEPEKDAKVKQLMGRLYDVKRDADLAYKNALDIEDVLAPMFEKLSALKSQQRNNFPSGRPGVTFIQKRKEYDTRQERINNLETREIPSLQKRAAKFRRGAIAFRKKHGELYSELEAIDAEAAGSAPFPSVFSQRRGIEKSELDEIIEESIGTALRGLAALGGRTSRVGAGASRTAAGSSVPTRAALTRGAPAAAGTGGLGTLGRGAAAATAARGTGSFLTRGPIPAGFLKAILGPLLGRIAAVLMGWPALVAWQVYDELILPFTMKTGTEDAPTERISEEIDRVYNTFITEMQKRVIAYKDFNFLELLGDATTGPLSLLLGGNVDIMGAITGWLAKLNLRETAWSSAIIKRRREAAEKYHEMVIQNGPVIVTSDSGLSKNPNFDKEDFRNKMKNEVNVFLDVEEDMAIKAGMEYPDKQGAKNTLHSLIDKFVELCDERHRATTQQPAATTPGDAPGEPTKGVNQAKPAAAVAATVAAATKARKASKPVDRSELRSKVADALKDNQISDPSQIDAWVSWAERSRKETASSIDRISGVIDTWFDFTRGRTVQENIQLFNEVKLFTPVRGEFEFSDFVEWLEKNNESIGLEAKFGLHNVRHLEQFFEYSKKYASEKRRLQKRSERLSKKIGKQSEKISALAQELEAADTPQKKKRVQKKIDKLSKQLQSKEEKRKKTAKFKVSKRKLDEIVSKEVESVLNKS